MIILNGRWRSIRLGSISVYSSQYWCQNWGTLKTVRNVNTISMSVSQQSGRVGGNFQLLLSFAGCWEMHFMFKYFTQDKSSWCITSSLKEKTEKTWALKTAGKWFRISAFFLNFVLRRGWWIVLSSRQGQAVPGLSLHNIRILEVLCFDINLEFSSPFSWLKTHTLHFRRHLWSKSVSSLFGKYH